MIPDHEYRWRKGRLASRSARALTVVALAASLVSTTAATAYAEPDTTTSATATTAWPTTTTPAPAPSADAAAESATLRSPTAPNTSESSPAARTTASPATTSDQAPVTTRPSTSAQQAPVQFAGPDKSAEIASTPATPPPSAAEDVEKPEREPGKRTPTGMDLVRSQQYALTVPADQLPELPAGAMARTQRAELPEGISQEDAELAERMALVANANCQFYGFSPFAVCGEIRNKYNAMGGPASFLGLPTSPEYQNPGNTGARSEFLNGSIYWSAATGAHPITPLFMTKWAQHNWEAGWMGYPTSDEIPNGDNIGSRQEFQTADAAIYWHNRPPNPGLAVIGGAIRTKWEAVGAQGGVLGYPTSDEKGTPDGVGRFNTFEYGSVYWSAPTGAHPVYGPVLEMWAAAGYEAGTYGYPIEDIIGTANGGDSQQFQHGTISVSPPNLGSPPWRVGADKTIGPNYDEALECIGGYDNGPLTFFHSTGETLYCRDFQYIYEGHFPGYLNEKDWNDFQTCLAYTLESTERGFSPNKNGTHGRTRYNTYSNVRSYAIVRDSDQSIFNAYTSGDGGRDWGGCRKNLS